MPTIAPHRLSCWILVPAMAALASAQVEEQTGRFMLYNSCDPLGVVVGPLPGGSPLVDLELPQVEAMVRGRLQVAGLYSDTGRTHVRVSVSRYAIRLRYMKDVTDAASDERKTIATFSRAAVVADGHSASTMLELSKLLNAFLASYRRVNLLACGDGLEPPEIRKGAIPPKPRRVVSAPAEGPIRQRAIRIDRWWPVPQSEQEKRETAHRIGDGGTSPKLLLKAEPKYSEKARQARVEGLVRLSAEVWEDGLPHNIRVVRSLGWGLDEKAVEAVRQWRFSPGTLDGKPVRVQVQIEVSFRLIESPERRR